MNIEAPVPVEAKPRLWRRIVDFPLVSLVIAVALRAWPDFSAFDTAMRVGRLAIVIGAAGGAFVVVLFACGFRIRDLKAHG